MSALPSTPNLLSQEIAALEQERRNIERELAELAKGKIKLELNGKLIEMELGILELANDLIKSRSLLEQKLARALSENPLGEKLMRSFMKEEQLRQALDLPDSGGGLAKLNTGFNQKAALIGCGTLMATPALIVIGIAFLAAGLFFLLGSFNSPTTGSYPDPALFTTPGFDRTYPIHSHSPNPMGVSSQFYPFLFSPVATSTFSATNLLSPSLADSSYRQPTDLPLNESAAGQLSSSSFFYSASSRDEDTASQKINVIMNPVKSYAGNQPQLAPARVNYTEGAGGSSSQTDAGDPPENDRVGLPATNAGGYNGPHGAFLPPGLLSVAALGLTGTPIVRALTQENQDEQGRANLSVVWPRPFEVAHFGAYPGELGNMVLLGTQSSLGLLRRLQLNDEIRIADRKGNLFVYRVVAFSPTGQSERMVDLATESWIFNNTAEAVLTILVTPPQDVVPFSKNPTTGQEQAALDDLTTTRRLAYRAVLSIYAPVPPTPFGTPVAVDNRVWQVPTPTIPAPTATATSTPTISPSPEVKNTASPVSNPTMLPGLPDTGGGGCANARCDQNNKGVITGRNDTITEKGGGN